MTSHLKGVVVCVAGDLNHDADDHQWTNENIKRWLELRGGKFVDEMNDSVTHLLCSRAAFKTKEAEVKYAKRIKCKIVTYEWLDDAILLYDQLKKKAPTSLYNPGKPRPEKEIVALYRKTPVVTRKVQADTDISSQGREKTDGNVKKTDAECPIVSKDAHGREGDKTSTQNKPPNIVKHIQTPSSPKQKEPATKKGVRESNALRDEKPQLAGIPHKHVPSGEYHIYRDPIDNFLYQVEVSCPDECGNPRGKRWVLQLFQSKSAPKDYRFGPVISEKQGARPKIYNGSGKAQTKHAAMKEFEDFFARRTGIKWAERLHQSARKQSSGHEFTYYPPAPGEPIAHANPRYRPKEVEGVYRRQQSDADALRAVTSLKRKRSGAFDDVKASRASRL